jgi:hypothetical protein
MAAVHQNKAWLLPYGYGGNALALALNTELFKQSGPRPDGYPSPLTWRGAREQCPLLGQVPAPLAPTTSPLSIAMESGRE